jgi:hypothetical protein
MRRTTDAIALAALLAACTPPADLDLLEPPGGSMTGYEPLAIDLTGTGLEAGEVTEVRVGGVLAWQPTALADGRLQVTVQGSPEPGPAPVVLWAGDRSVALEQDYEYADVVDDALRNVMAFGASLTQGVSDATPTFESQAWSPALQAARSMGAYFGQPVLVPDLFPSMTPDNIGPPPECRPTGPGSFIRDGITEVLVDLAYDDGSGFGYELGRMDAGLQVQNISAGNFKLGSMLRGPTISDFVEIFLGHLSFDPYGGFGEELEMTQLEILEEARPSLVFTFDSYGNDGLGPAAGNGDQTALEEIEADITEMVERLAAAADHAFNSTLDATVREYNAILAEQAVRFDNVYVVPFHDGAWELHTDGRTLNGEELTTQILGGLLSFDGLHFSPTGYALAAELLVQTINDELGLELPLPDVEAVAAQDPHLPSVVRASGRDVDACWAE